MVIIGRKHLASLWMRVFFSFCVCYDSAIIRPCWCGGRLLCIWIAKCFSFRISEEHTTMDIIVNLYNGIILMKSRSELCRMMKGWCRCVAHKWHFIWINDDTSMYLSVLYVYIYVYTSINQYLSTNNVIRKWWWLKICKRCIKNSTAIKIKTKKWNISL